VIHIEKNIEDQMKKLAEIFYRQYIIHLRNGQMDHIEKVTNNFGKKNQDNMLIRKMTEILYHQYIKELKEGRIHTNKDITKIKERVK
jgi:hypothetical protein